jgi:hypothetical protein
MPSINLANVNISLNEFQRLSKGDHNAGEVKLAGEAKLAKINNHVHMTGRNVVAIPHEEVFAIKKAFVTALADGGVGADEITRIRKDLGLAPDGAVDRSLKSRSVRPLTRQQIREILDRNAATLNAFAEEHGTETRIRTSEQLYGTDGMRADRAGRRDAVNAALAAPGRALDVNKDIANFQRVVSNGGEFTDYGTRIEMQQVAMNLLDELFVACHGSPREDVPATATLRLPDGQTLSIPTGLSEAAFARRLEEQILRLGGAKSRPVPADLEVHSQFRSLATQEARQTFLDALANDPRRGQKARIAAIAILYERGVTDYATLNLANRLSDDDAIALARHLATLPENATAGAIANDAFLKALAEKPPKPVKEADQAYVPALSNEDFNRGIKESFLNNKLLPGYRILAAQTADIVRGRLGARGLPDGKRLNYIVDSSFIGSTINAAALAAGGRVTPENLREQFLAAALRCGAERIVEGLVVARLTELGRDTRLPSAIVKSFVARNPQAVERLAAAQSPAEVEDIIADIRADVAEAVRINGDLNEVYAGLEGRVRKSLANRLGVPLATIDAAGIQLKGLMNKAAKLQTSIANGKPPLTTREEFQQKFDELADAFVDERIQRLADVDALDLPEAVKDDIKVQLLSTEKVKDIDMAFLAEEAKKINFAPLEEALNSFSPKETVFKAMRAVTQEIYAAVDRMLAGKEEVGPDDNGLPIAILAKLLVTSRPGLDRFLRAFYAKPDVKAEVQMKNHTLDPNAPSFGSSPFEQFSSDPAVNGMNAADIRAKKHILEMSRQMAAFRATGGPEGAAFLAAGGAERAEAEGYHVSELPMLARAFALHKAATGCSDDVALEAALDHQGKTRRLVAYGGRFTESVENFRAGLALLDKFAAWYANLSADFAAGKFDTVTKSNAASTFVYAKAVRGYEMFIFQDLAINTADLNEQDPEKLFGVANNDAMNFFVRGNGSGCTGTLVALPPAKRQVVYAAFRVLEPHVTELGKHSTDIPENENVLARILRHFDEVADLVKSGQLTRARLNQILTPDLDLPPDATPRQVKEAIENRYFERYGNSQAKLMEVFVLLTTTGCTVTELMTAMEGGERPAPLPEIASTTMGLEEIDGTTSSGRKYMLVDLKRPSNPSFIANGQHVLSEENNHFTVKIGGETIPCAKGAEDKVNAHIADKIEALCGKVHVAQASTVMRGLSQGAHGPLMGIMPEHGIEKRIGSEHTPMTYTLSRNEETGAVTIRYSEPEGFPFKFHWETTVALDGTSTTTPVVVEA